MATEQNRPRQLLLLRDALLGHRGKSLIDAFDALASEQGHPTRVQGHLLNMVIYLPQKAVDQSLRLLGQTAESYTPRVEQVVHHFRSQTFASQVDDWLRVFDSDATVELGLKALSDLVGLHLQLHPPDPEQVGGLRETVRDLIEEIKTEQSLDDDTREYLLEIAFHLLLIVQRLDLFGADGIVELQGHFLATMVNFQPDLAANGAADPTTSAGRGLAHRLWDATVKANVVVGLPSSALTIATVAHHALSHGNP